jgi:hypothetical protein
VNSAAPVCLLKFPAATICRPPDNHSLCSVIGGGGYCMLVMSMPSDPKSLSNAVRVEAD